MISIIQKSEDEYLCKYKGENFTYFKTITGESEKQAKKQFLKAINKKSKTIFILKFVRDFIGLLLVSFLMYIGLILVLSVELNK